MGPQVFEKSLSCVNNLRLQDGPRRSSRATRSTSSTSRTAAAGTGRTGEPPKTNPAYYLRFCKSYARMGGDDAATCRCDNVAFVHPLPSLADSADGLGQLMNSQRLRRDHRTLPPAPHRACWAISAWTDTWKSIRPAETSIETGLPVYNVMPVRAQPGGAGTILNNLVALGVGEIIPLGFAGDDGEGFELRPRPAVLPGVSHRPIS